MINKYLLLGIVLIVLALPMINAEVQTLGTYKVNNIVNLVQTCTNSTYANITKIIYPDSTVALSGDYPMTRVIDNYNYSFPSTSILGQYLVYGNCDEDGIRTNWVYDFSITPTGIIQESISKNPTLLIITLLTVLCIGAAFALKNPYFGFIGGILLMLLGVYTMIYGFNNYTDIYTRGVSSFFIGMGLFFTVVSAYEWTLDSSSGEDD